MRFNLSSYSHSSANIQQQYLRTSRAGGREHFGNDALQIGVAYQIAIFRWHFREPKEISSTNTPSDKCTNKSAAVNKQAGKNFADLQKQHAALFLHFFFLRYIHKFLFFRFFFFNFSVTSANRLEQTYLNSSPEILINQNETGSPF